MGTLNGAPTMNHHHARLAARLVATIACATCALPGFAQSAAHTARYHDGTMLRTVTLEPRWEALITPATAPQARQAASPLPPAQVTLRRTGLPPTRTADPPGSQRSPIWREGSSPAGRLMALPGGVIVQFAPDWTDADIHAWSQGKNLQISQRLDIPGNWYLFASAPGTASLELANQLHTSGEVLSASPNWWKHTTTR